MSLESPPSTLPKLTKPYVTFLCKNQNNNHITIFEVLTDCVGVHMYFVGWIRYRIYSSKFSWHNIVVKFGLTSRSRKICYEIIWMHVTRWSIQCTCWKLGRATLNHKNSLKRYLERFTNFWTTKIWAIRYWCNNYKVHMGPKAAIQHFTHSK